MEDKIDKSKIIEWLKDFNPQDVEKFASYIYKLSTEKDKNKELKNP